MTEPFAYVAEQDGRCLGIISPRVPPKELKRFYRDFAGCEIKTIADRAAWDDYRLRVPFGRASE